MTTEEFLAHAKEIDKEILGIWYEEDYFETVHEDIDSFMLSPVVKAYYTFNKPFMRKTIHCHRGACRKDKELKALYPELECYNIS